MKYRLYNEEIIKKSYLNYDNLFQMQYIIFIDYFGKVFLLIVVLILVIYKINFKIYLFNKSNGNIYNDSFDSPIEYYQTNILINTFENLIKKTSIINNKDKNNIKLLNDIFNKNQLISNIIIIFDNLSVILIF